MSWLKVPGGKDEDLSSIPRMVLWFFIVPVGVLVVLAKLYPFVREKLEGTPTTSSGGSTGALGGITQFFDSIGSFFESLWSLVPLLIVILVAAPFLYVIVQYFRYRYYRQQATADVRYLRILPSDQTKLEVDKVMTLTRTFGGMIRHLQQRINWGTPWFRIRFAMTKHSREIGIYLSYPKDKRNSVYDTIRSVYPTAEIHDLRADQFPEPEAGGSGGHFRFARGRRKGLPLASLEQKKESQLGNILNCLRPGTIVDLQFAPTTWKALEERSEDALDDLKDKKMADLDPEQKARKISLIRRVTGRELTFQVRLSLWSNHEDAANIVRSTANAIETTMNYDGAVYFWKHDWWNPIADHNPIPYPIPFTLMIWTGEELANLFHLPPADHWIYQEPSDDAKDSRGYITHLKKNQRSLESHEWDSGVMIGQMKHPLEQREVRVPYDQLSKHFILTGANGMGKSSCAVEIIQSMIDDWVKDPDTAPGFTLLDPAREIIAIVENRLRTLVEKGVELPLDKIHHYNLSDDTTHMLGLNLLTKTKGYTVNQVAEQVAEVILYKSGQSESVVRGKRLLTMIVHGLLEDNKEHTILGIDDMVNNPRFRKEVLAEVKDPYVKRFWANVTPSELKEMGLLLNRIDPLLQDPTMRRMFLQLEMGLEIRRYMDEGHLVMIDLFGMEEHELKVTVGHLLSQYHLVAKKRAFGSKFHLLMIEEAHLVQVPLLREIFLEDRRHDMGLGLVTRDIDQFEDRELLQAIKANVGMVLSCAQTEGADEVQDLTRNFLKTDFLEQLPERTVAVYIRSKRNQRSDATTFVISNHPPYVCTPEGEIADHRTVEVEEAHQWGLEWGMQLMRNDPKAREIEELDHEIAEYMDKTTELAIEGDIEESSA
ncbi:hypothetical protein SAMN05444392_103275 [Seinonella peptonophila]|uniref:Uncharacterized protein n=1 Tax=Seinonella peptonophila TaxID=112248 RepID=A0A1M4WLE5_9BACL|nr:hypothetical protein [Seinonella peptonophila]SHE82046.1 hypothetical protein SAMN05444392_103275 [Seinonella peptonophila]